MFNWTNKKLTIFEETYHPQELGQFSSCLTAHGDLRPILDLTNPIT